MVKLNLAYDVLHLETPETLIIATDNSGAIGEKKADEVQVSYETVAYFLFRVTYMECLAAGALPSAIVVHNFNGDPAWEKLRAGFEQGFNEVGIPALPISGSSESNFEMQQSATGLSMIGHQLEQDYCDWSFDLTESYKIAVIGEPLVGAEVLTQANKVASLHHFKWLNEQEEVLALIPVGSKGIQSELRKIHSDLEVSFSKELAVHKSAGPATCYLVVYAKEFHTVLQEKITEPIFVGSW